jgi:protein disulfide-isomerase A1
LVADVWEATWANALQQKSGKSIVHCFISSGAERDRLVKELRPLAKQYQEYIHITTTDVNEYSEMPGVVGLKEGSKKGLALENPNTGEFFPYRGRKKIDAGVVEAFLVDVTEGRIAPKSPQPGAGGHAARDEL